MTAAAAQADLVQQQLLRFLESRTKIFWRPDDDLFASGAISSLFAMELVLYLEQTFGITIDGDNLTLANFRTVASMTELVCMLRNGEAKR